MEPDFESSRLSEKERYFREFSIWPVFSELDSEKWLTNFKSYERKFAERLLTNFCYFNEQITDALLRAALQRCFNAAADKDPLSSRSIIDYVKETAFVMCQGERPHATDSGHIFARKLRDKIRVPEHQICTPCQALKRASEFSRFVFFDDFTGSGNQFLNTWNTIHSICGNKISFSTLSANSDLSFGDCILD